MLATQDLLRKMISHRPVTGDVACVNELTACVRDYLADAGIVTRTEELDGRNILFASTTGCKTVDVLFNAHLDVVPAAETQFEPCEKEGWIYGRGAHDCLGHCALLANTLIRVAEEADAGIVFSTDEETGGATTRAMVERGYAARKLILIVDGHENALITAQKGVLTVTLRAAGTSCHAAMPWEGDNAIDRLIDGYLRIKPLFPAIEPPDEWHNTMAATVVGGGNAHNRVPDSAEMTVNIRFTEEASAAALLARLREASGLEVTPTMQTPPVFCDPAAPEIQRLKTCMETTLKKDVTVERLNGATDARHFRETGVPIAIIGTRGTDMHGKHEAVELAGLEAYENVLTAFLRGSS